MTTLTIKLLENDGAVMQVLNGLSKMGAIIIEKESPQEIGIPDLAHTRQERIASVRRVMADYRTGGRTFSDDELEQRMAQW